MPRGCVRRGSKSRQVTMGSLSEVVAFELRPEWTSNHKQIWGNGVPEETREESHVGMNLAISRKDGSVGGLFLG